MDSASLRNVKVLDPMEVRWYDYDRLNLGLKVTMR